MKKTIKASLSLLLCILTLSGCGKGETTIPSSTPGSTNTATPTTPTDKDTTTSSTNTEHKYTDFSEEDKELQKNISSNGIQHVKKFKWSEAMKKLNKTIE